MFPNFSDGRAIRFRAFLRSGALLYHVPHANFEEVTREEVHQRLWPNGTIVEFDHSINAAIKRLRQPLEDSPETPLYVETLPPLGDRFIGSVEQPPPAAEAVPSDEPEPSPGGLEGEIVSHYRILEMLLDLGRINTALQAAQTAAAKVDAKGAVEELDRALDIADNIRQQRNQAFADAVAVWYRSWYPRVTEANGRKFLDQVDDVKDHFPVRTVDMSYLIYRQLLYPLGDWAESVQAVRNRFAQAHGLPARARRLEWRDTSLSLTAPRADVSQTTLTGFARLE